MSDPMSSPSTRCPWCSAPLADPSVERCPSCGAALVAKPDAPTDIKGVTMLDTEAILRARSELSRPQRSNRLISFITGEMPVDTSTPPSGPEVFAPPPDDVRREMLRLQLEAEQADRAAEVVALKADELARLGIPLSEIDEGAASQAAAEPGAAPAPAPAEAVAPEPEVPEPDALEPVAPEPGWPAELTPDEPGETSRG